jgi:hypothetical protein
MYTIKRRSHSSVGLVLRFLPLPQSIDIGYDSFRLHTCDLAEIVGDCKLKGPILLLLSDRLKNDPRCPDRFATTSTLPEDSSTAQAELRRFPLAQAHSNWLLFRDSVGENKSINSTFPTQIRGKQYSWKWCGY